MKRKTTHLSDIAVIASIICVSVPAVNAQSGSGTLPAELLACAEEKDVIQRLSCYDREVAAVRAAQQMPAAPAAVSESATSAPKPDVTSAPVPAAAPVETVTSAAAVMAPKESEAIAEAPAKESAPRQSGKTDGFGLSQAIEEITADVVDIRERPYGELIIRLDNGQVWEQKHLDRRFRLRVGETVTISRGAVSGFRLSGSSNNSIQVKRLK